MAFHAQAAVQPAVADTRMGSVEYTERGEAMPLLSLHGSPAAFENGLLIAEFARVNGFRMIAVSRPGYGGTPLGTGRTPVEQADALAALLDTLGLEQVAVVGMSGGGSAGYALAGAHPDRVCCLLQVESIALPAAAPRGRRRGLRLTALARLAAWDDRSVPVPDAGHHGRPGHDRPRPTGRAGCARPAASSPPRPGGSGSVSAKTTTPSSSSPTYNRCHWTRSPAPL